MISSLLLFSFLLPLAVFTILKKVNALYSLFFVLFFQGVFSMMGFPMGVVKAVIEVLVWFFFAIALFDRSTVSRDFPGLFFFILFTIFYATAIVLTNTLNFDAYSYFRHYLNSFILMAAVYMFPFPLKQVFRVNRFIFLLFILQVFASIFKLFSIGQYEEYAGTMIITNGSINTIFPLIAISFMVFAWFYLGRKRIYMLYSLGFVFMGWVGNKRGIYFYLIILIMLILWKRFRDLRQGSFLPASVIRLIPVGLILFAGVFYLGVRLTPTLNPDRKVWGRYDSDFLATYLYTYNLMDERTGDYRGRFGGTYVLLQDAISGGGMALRNPTLQSNLVGFGPDKIVGDVRIRYERQRQSGLQRLSGTIGTGFTNVFIGLGLLGVIFTVWFFMFYNRRVSRISKTGALNPYWQSIASGTFIMGPIFLLDFFTYSASFNTTNTIYLTFFYFVGILLKPDFLTKYNTNDYPKSLF
jgi:hypothetical protein